LSANDEEVTEFIRLRALNQHLAIVIDSDKRTSRDRINETKSRIVSEFSTGGAVAWVTAGREIENYIDYDLLQRSVSQVHPTIYGKPAGGGRYDHAIAFLRPKQRGKSTGGRLEVADKVKVAKIVSSQPANLNVLGLHKHVEALVAMIRAANL